MVPYQPNPDMHNPDDISPTQYDIGWRAEETLLSNPFVSEAVKRRFAHKAGRVLRHPVSKVPDGDSSRDPHWNVKREPLSDEQLAIKQRGIRVLRSWRNIKDNLDAPTEPEQPVLPGLEYIDEIDERRKKIEAEAQKEELEIDRRVAAGEIPDYDLSGPDYRFFKRPDERS